MFETQSLFNYFICDRVSDIIRYLASATKYDNIYVLIEAISEFWLKPIEISLDDLGKFVFNPFVFAIVMLKVSSTVKIRGTRVPQKAIVPVGGPRPYSIIILNMRFIPKASLRASSQITASSYILEHIYKLIIQSTLPLPLLGRWLANKLTVLLRGFGNSLTPKACIDTQ